MTRKPQNIYMPIDRFVANVLRRASGDERSAWITSFALTLADGEGDECFAKELLESAEAAMAANRQRQAQFRKKRQKPSNDAAPRPGESANLANAPKDHMTAVPGNQAEGAESLPANGLDITEVYEFAEEWHLDDIDCREWWEMTVRDRGGCDRDGNPILNWKGAVKRYCAAKAKRRAGR